MRTLSILSLSCMFPLSGGIALAAEPMTFDAAESAKEWTFGNGPEFPGAAGSIVWENAAGCGKPGCLALRFSFENGGNYVHAACPLPKENDYRVASLWVRKPAGNRITFRAVDSSGQTFQKSADFNTSDWQQLEVNLKRWTHSFGGANDMKVHWPMRSLAVLIENTGATKEGTLLVDDLAFSKDAPPLPGAATTYIAWDPRSKIRWGVGGGPGNSFVKDTWQYTFNAGSAPALANDFSLLGQPARMRLFFESDGAGHEVFVTMGSHFQNFRRSVGKLTEKGPQTIDVPLGDMQGWEHSDGENDGQARLPLRVVHISLTRGSGPEKGTLKLMRIEAETELPAHQKVVISPDVTQKGEAAAFEVEIQNLRNTEVKGQLVCDFRQGDRLDRQVRDMALPAAGGPPAITTFEVPLAGFNVTEGVFRWIEDGSVSDPVSIGMSSPVAEPGTTDLDPASPFGVGLYLYRHGGPQAKERMNELAALARDAGVKWTREEIDWHRTEPQKGQFDWAFYDDLVEVAHANGISVYGLLCYWSTFTKKDTPEGVDEYCQWAQQVVRHYKGKIKHWEIWNEPNIFFWSGPKELYFKLLAKVYDVIKAEDPEAQVLGCSTAGIDIDFIKRTIAAGARFDALTIHPYRGELNDLEYIKELRDVKALVDGRPVWITEMGWPSQRVWGRTEREQASYVARTYLTSVASGAVASVSWYDFRNDGNDPYYNEFNFGLVRNDLRLKPGYRALATIARTLAGLKTGQQIDLPPDAYAFRFSDGKRDVVAACAPQNGRLLAFRGEPAIEIVNVFGERIKPATTADLQIITLDAGMPVYLKGPAGFRFEPAQPPASLTIARSSTRLGESVEIRCRPNLPLRGWQLPPGWPEPTRDMSGFFHLVVPENARPGDVELAVTVTRNGQPLRLPIKLSVQPKVIRL